MDTESSPNLADIGDAFGIDTLLNCRSTDGPNKVIRIGLSRAIGYMENLKIWLAEFVLVF